MRWAWASAWRGARLCAAVALAMSLSLTAGRRDYKNRMDSMEAKQNSDISLWIDERQVRMFSGISMQVFAILNGHISPYILDPNFSHKLPTIPSEVGYVNFTWRSRKRYQYHFDTLTSSDPKLLKPPVLSIKTQGRVPKAPKEFSIFLICLGNNSGVATFEIGLVLKNGRNIPLKGTPLRLNLKKECAQRGVYLERTGPDPECDKKCANQGWCNEEKICQCPEGYMGQHCRTALCYPQCMNGGNCTAPGLCSCPPGYQGRHCEGGICSQKCLNGGKCIQKDTCECPKGYYGLRCEFSKCVIPCLGGGRCKGVNKCRCPPGLGGDHCEVGRRAGPCPRPCRHGLCRSGVCVCEPGWRGRFCHRTHGSSEESGEFKRPR
ncbi:PREDICTED: protein shifted-like isoform X2 [Papilio xuthus]|uniref:Protein shifted-like isoform X2 n=1 Tax=Papilio xuthus TaxID=66420 RepID=A0AAJ6ZNM0_PAPXU|nr:PREDICTED: protein shifted-like isoform X2 [Papilio xuthus]